MTSTPFYREFVSPDGALRLIVQTDDDGDVSIGFHGAAAHTHANILAELSGLTDEQAVQGYLERIMADGEVIAILRDNGKVQETWVSDDPHADMRYLLKTESIEHRYWSGKPWAGS